MKLKPFQVLFPIVLLIVVVIYPLSVALAAPDAAGLAVSRLTPTGGAGHPFDLFEVQFNSAVQAGSFTTADIVFSDPGGPITAAAVTALANDRYQVSFPGLTGLNRYSLEIGPNILDLSGHAMDQNHNGIYGEGTDAYRASLFSLDTAIDGANTSYDGRAIVVHASTLTVNGSHPFASLEVLGGAQVTHSAATYSAEYHLDLTLTDSLWVDSASKMNVSGRGYLPGRTLANVTGGAATGATGGSYGGLGGEGPWGGATNLTYGDYKNPNEPGAGSANGGIGGGLARITASSVTLEGQILANGTPGDCNTGGGAGGGVRISTGSLAGTGSIHADGGYGGGTAGCQGGGGGGGRIAIYYSSLSGFDLAAQVQAVGGGNATLTNPQSAVGTVYLQQPGQPGELHIDSHGAPTGMWTPLGLPADTAFSVDRMVLSGAGVVAAPQHEMTIQAGSVTLLDHAVLTHQAATASQSYSLNMTITGALEIDTDSAIDVSNRGYLVGYTRGNTTSGGANGASGGSYGGAGTPVSGVSNEPYGDFTDPNEPGAGSGNGGSGGGLVRITTGSLTLDGQIRANGTPGGCNNGGGAGGGVRISTGSLTGAGSIHADGGLGGGPGACAGGGGSGGRIAVYYSSLTGFDPVVQVQAVGGGNLTLTNPQSAVGTVYLKQQGQPGELHIDNHGAPTGMWTPLGLPADTSFSVDRLVLSGVGVVAAPQHNSLAIQTSLPIQTSSVAILNGAILTHQPATTNQIYSLDLTVSGLLAIDNTSAIDVSGRGYLPQRTFGNTTTGGASGATGGSYGGLGGEGPWGGSTNSIYGNFKNPNELGAGSANGGVGGGLARISAGSLALDGQIRANGTPGDCNTGGGAGGGIRISTGSLTGVGSVHADGGYGGGTAGCSGGGGGGGRIAIYYANLSGFAPVIQAQAVGGGNKGLTNPKSAVGTVYLQKQGQPGELHIDSHGAPTGMWTPLGLPADTSFDVDRLVLSGAGVVAAPQHEMPIQAGSVTLLDHAVLTHQAATASQTYSLNLAISGALEIDTDSAIDVSSRGYLVGHTLGNTTSGGANGASGGSYGGAGTPVSGVSNDTYGDFTNPNELGAGSGNYGSGGGLVRITAGSLTLEGRIRANGTPGDCNTGGGAGGGIRISTGSLTGAGSIHADGGLGGGPGACAGGGGSGGRIAVYYSSLTGFDPVVQVQAVGGGNLTLTNPQSAVGTVYLKKQGQPGELHIDSHGIPTGMWTPLGLPADASLSVDRMVLSGAGVVAAPQHEMPIQAGSVALLDHAVLTHQAATATQTYSLNMTVSGALEIDADSAIDVSSRGYLVGHTRGNTTSGGANGASGGSYGGAATPVSGVSNVTYGDFTDPNEPGAGSGNGGPGGGLARIKAGSLTLDGRILANGTPGDCNYGGGAGGGIRISTINLTGTGSMHADGGLGGGVNGCAGGGGSGGRIAVYYSSLTGFDPVVQVQAVGGGNLTLTNPQSAVGTVYLKAQDQPGELHIDSHDVPTGMWTPFGLPADASLSVGRLVVSGAGVYAVPQHNGLPIQAGSVTILNGAILTHLPATTTQEYSLDLTVSGVLAIDSTSAIDVSGRGYLAGRTLGNSASGGANGASGGSYGGTGFPTSGVSNLPYGNEFSPSEPGAGSGNGGSGGGLVRITAGSINLDGQVLANGAGGACNAGGGAGGGILVNAGTLTGAGAISADGGYGGGAAGACSGGGGGGGRVAVYTWNTRTLGDSRIHANGGFNQSQSGQAGSVQISQSPVLFWRPSTPALFHGAETLVWLAYAVNPSADSAEITVSGQSQPLSVVAGQPVSGAFTWDTRNVPDGNYSLILSEHAADGQILGSVTRQALINNSLAWHGGVLSVSETWGPQQIHLVDSDLTLPAGMTLTLQPGTIVKFAPGARLLVTDGGILNAPATVDIPIILTALADDSAGGDINLDGTLTAPTPGAWQGIQIQGTGQINLSASVDVRYAVTTHSGNLTANETWRHNTLHLVAGNFNIPNGLTLTIEAGAVVKFASGKGLTVQAGGTLVATGSVAQPVVFTSYRDDAYGGDSDKDGGINPPAAGDWSWINIGGTGNLNYSIIAYSGRGDGDGSGDGALRAEGGSAAISLSNSSIHDALYEGITAWGGSQVTVTNSVISLNDRGVTSDGGSTLVTLINCTLYSNRMGLWGHSGRIVAQNSVIANSLDYGIISVLGSVITVRYSDVWSTTGANYTNVDPGGSNGNISIDPSFRDADKGNYHLQFKSPLIDAADGGIAPAADLMGSPRYDDPRVTNTGLPTSSGAYADMGAYEFVEEAKSPIDLVADHVSGPANAVAGSEVKVTWQVRNIGLPQTQGLTPADIQNSDPTVATGPWHDQISLVAETPDRGVTEIPVAEVISEGVLGPGEAADFSATVRVPGGTEGAWRWKVTTNVRGEVFEGVNSSNNASPLTATVHLSVTEMVPGALLNASFANLNQPGWYRVNQAAGQELLVTLQLVGAANRARLYAGIDSMPTDQDFDLISRDWNSATVRLSIPAPSHTQMVYLLAIPQALAGPNQSYTLQAAISGFDLISLGLQEAGNSGLVSIPLFGSGFNGTLQVRLQSGASQVAAGTVNVEDSGTALARFNLVGLSEGLYDLVASQQGQDRTLHAIFAVKAGSGGQFNARAVIPQNVRTGRVFQGMLEYTNSGDADQPVPLIILQSNGPNPVWLDADWVGGNQVQFLAVPPEGAFGGVLRPGETHSLAFSSRVEGSPVAFSVAWKDASSTEPVDWNAIKESVLQGASPLRQQAWQALVAATGPTTGGYIRALTQAVEEARGYGVNLLTVRSALLYLVERQVTLLSGAQVSGTLSLEGSAHSLARKTILLTAQGTGEIYSAQTWYNGSFAFRNLPNGTYDLRVPDYLPAIWGQVVVNTPLSGLQVAVRPGAELSGLVLDPGGRPLPGASVSARQSTTGQTYTTNTDAGGVYLLSGLPDGEYHLWVTAENYVTPVSPVITISSTLPNGLSLQLQEGGSLTGRILSPTNQPIPYARVLASPRGADSRSGKETTSGPDGRYSIVGLEQGTYQVTAAAGGFGAGLVTGVNVTARSQTAGVDVNLSVVANLSGIVRVAGGGPLAGVAITSDAPRPSSDPILTSSDGVFVLGDLPSGKLQVWASAPGYLTSQQTVTLNPGENSPLTISLRPKGQISGVVHNDGAPLAGIPITLLGPHDQTLTTATSATGEFGFGGLPDGSYILALGGESGGMSIGRHSLTLGPTNNVFATTLDLHLARLTGYVRTSTGGPAAQVKVGLLSGGKIVATSATDLTGAYHFLVLQNTPVVVISASDMTGLLHSANVAITLGGEVVAPDLTGGNLPLTVTVRGDDPGNPPLAGAVISLTAQHAGLTQTTGSTGQVTFSALLPGTYNLVVQAEGRAAQTRTVVIGASGVEETFQLHSGLRLIGVVSGSDGKPAQGIRVIAYDAGTGLSGLAITAANGSYEITSLTSGTYDVWFSGGPYQFAHQASIPVHAPETAVANVTLSPGGCTVRGQVLNDLLEPVFGASVQVLAGDGTPLASTLTDGSGAYQLGSLPPELAAMAASGQGYGRQTQPVTISDGLTLNFNFPALVGLGVQNPGPVQSSIQKAAALSAQNATAGYSLMQWQEWLTQMPPAPERANLDTDEWRHSWSQAKLPEGCPDLLDEFLAARDKAYASDLALGRRFSNWNFSYQGLTQLNTSAVNAAAAMVAEIGIKTTQLMLTVNQSPWGSGGPLEIGKENLVPNTLSKANLIANAQSLGGAIIGSYTSGNMDAGDLALSQLITLSGQALDAGRLSPDASILASIYDLGKEILQLRQNLKEDNEAAAIALGAYLQAQDYYDNTLKEHQKNLLALNSITSRCATPTPTVTGTKATRTATTTPATRTPSPTPRRTATQPPCPNAPCLTPPPPTPPNPTRAPSVVATERHSGDPNEKVSLGVGSQGFVHNGETIQYTIYFENVPSDSAPAQEVRITDALSSSLDWSSVELVALGFNGQVLTLSAGTQTYTTTATVSTDTYPVSVDARLDPASGLLTWTLASVDPVTNDLPADPLSGFLPPNDASHRGEGYVTFRVRAVNGLPDGAAIYNKATIVFDINAPIDTNRVTNTVDRNAPASNINPLPAVSPNTFFLSLAGADASGSGIASYAIYVSVDGGPYVLWKANLTGSTAAFTGQLHHTYRFYSLAVDRVGNREPTKQDPDAQTYIDNLFYLPLLKK